MVLSYLFLLFLFNVMICKIEMLPSRGIVEEESEDGFKYCSRTHFVLVHGNSVGAWNWYKIRTRLEKHGYKVSCLDLKSAGIDATNVSSILTFEDYNKPLVDFLSALPDNEKVILVGHSAGGTECNRRHTQIWQENKYSCVRWGNNVEEWILTEQDRIDGIPDTIRQPPTNSTMTREDRRKIVSNLKAEEDAILSSMLYKDGPVKVITEAKFGESPGIDEVTRVYIKTIHDQVLKPVEQQDAMIKKWPPSDVFLLESDHNPHISAPSDLVRMLIKAATSTKIFTGTCT